MAQSVRREESSVFVLGWQALPTEGAPPLILHRSSARLPSSCYPLRAAAKVGGWLSPRQSAVNKQELTALGQVDLGSVGGREEIQKVSWKKRLGLSWGQGGSQPENGLFCQRKELDHTAEKKRKETRVRAPLSHLKTKTKSRWSRDPYRGLTSGSWFVVFWI